MKISNVIPIRHVQIGTISRPLGLYKGTRLGCAVLLEYMGSSEFEFGAPAASIDRFHETTGVVTTTTKLDQFQRDGQVCRLLHQFNDEQLATYVTYMQELWEDKRRTKESHYFLQSDKENDFLTRKIAGTDFWWDIDNDVFWSFDKNFMNRIQVHLKASYVANHPSVT